MSETTSEVTSEVTFEVTSGAGAGESSPWLGGTVAQEPWPWPDGGAAVAATGRSRCPGTARWLVAAVVLVLVLGAGVLGYLLAGAPRGGRPVAAPGPGAVQVDAQLAAVVGRLATLGYQVTPKAGADDVDCVANSYGATRAYLAAHHCVGLRRVLLEAHDQRGGAALVAVAWVGMPDPDAATALRAELDRPGTGNLTALPGDDPRDRAVVFNGLYYGSARQGTAVAVAEAQPLGPGLTAAQLKALATGAVS